MATAHWVLVKNGYRILTTSGVGNMYFSTFIYYIVSLQKTEIMSWERTPDNKITLDYVKDEKAFKILYYMELDECFIIHFEVRNINIP